ncbi:MAG: rod shape-determining protein MreC [Chlorobiaceae bacterium]|jgi:rod shape-determining protein MreC|nr:rod shape-determining protein MreC [Chlorobiaceae bacterium]
MFNTENEKFRRYSAFVNKYSTYLLFLLFCSISVLFIKLQNRETLDAIRSGAIEFSSFLSEKVTDIGEIFNVRNENERLLAVNATLLSKIIKQDAEIADIRNRQKLVADTTVDASRFIMAKVVGRKFSDRENMLLINAGRDRGIKQNMTVFTPAGLVGRVVFVSEHYSKVMPLIHHEFKVIVESDKSSSMGILSWSGGKEDIAEVEHIPISTSLKINERMLTSDFSTFSVRGIPVGRVISMKPDKLFYRVDVQLAVDYSTLSYVLIAPLKAEHEKTALLKANSASSKEDELQ